MQPSDSSIHQNPCYHVTTADQCTVQCTVLSYSSSWAIQQWSETTGNQSTTNQWLTSPPFSIPLPPVVPISLYYPISHHICQVLSHYCRVFPPMSPGDVYQDLLLQLWRRGEDRYRSKVRSRSSPVARILFHGCNLDVFVVCISTVLPECFALLDTTQRSKLFNEIQSCHVYQGIFSPDKYCKATF